MNKNQKIILIAAAIIVVLLVAVIVLNGAVSNAQKRLSLLESVYAEMSVNKAGLISRAEETKALKARAAEGKNRNFVSEMEKAAADCGLSKMLKKINFVTQREEGQFRGVDYEMKLEGVDINTVVNFIYRITSSGIVIKVKKCSVSVSFENPSLLNISLLVSHIT